MLQSRKFQSRSAEFSALGFLAGLIVVLLLIWLAVIPLIAHIRSGVKSAYKCTGECYSSCPNEYMHQLNGDSDCDKQSKGTVCCEPLQTGPGQFVKVGDVKLFYNNDKTKPLSNGETVTLAPLRKGSSGGDFNIGGTFTLQFGSTAKGEKCYWQVGKANEWSEDVMNPSNYNVPCTENGVFCKIFNGYVAFSKGTTPQSTSTSFNPKTLKNCKEFAGTSTIKIPIPTYLEHLGETMKYSLFVIDPNSCGEDATSAGNIDLSDCNTYTRSVKIKIPDRHPQIHLFVNNKEVSKSSLTPLKVGITNTFKLVVDQPLTECGANIEFPKTSAMKKESLNTLKKYFSRTSSSNQKSSSKKDNLFTEDCFVPKQYTKEFDLNLPDDVARGIPFDINLSTRLSSGSGNKNNKVARVTKAVYHFQIEPATKFMVLGPSPGLTKEKPITLMCKDAACSDFSTAFVNDPFACNPSKSQSLKFTHINNLSVYGTNTPTKTNTGTWRFTLRGEENDGKFLCVKAHTGNTYLYSVGFSGGVPMPLMIDSTPPQLVVDYNPWKSVLTFHCSDPVSSNLPISGTSGEVYVSGCKEKPYSYAYLVDPVMFVTSILTGGKLAPGFNGCPDPNTGYWLSYNSNKPEMQYPGRDIRVICVRATDNAGNNVVKSKLLFSGQEALAAFLRANG